MIDPIRRAGHHRHRHALAQVLGQDRSGFDHPYDYDILTAAVGAVLKAKPASKVKVLADGRTKLTAFLPHYAAFQRLVADQHTRKWAGEKKGFAAVAGLGTVESVLLYHVVPGVTPRRRRRAPVGATAPG